MSVELLLDRHSNLAYLTLNPIVLLTVEEHELNVIDELLYLGIFVFLEFQFDGAKVHGILHDQVVVGNFECLCIHWLSEELTLWISLQI